LDPQGAIGHFPKKGGDQSCGRQGAGLTWVIQKGRGLGSAPAVRNREGNETRILLETERESEGVGLPGKPARTLIMLVRDRNAEEGWGASGGKKGTHKGRRGGCGTLRGGSENKKGESSDWKATKSRKDRRLVLGCLGLGGGVDPIAKKSFTRNKLGASGIRRRDKRKGKKKQKKSKKKKKKHKTAENKKGGGKQKKKNGEKKNNKKKKHKKKKVKKNSETKKK